MGYHDNEFPGDLQFLANLGSGTDGENTERLRRKLKKGQGLALFRADQLDALTRNLEVEPQIKLEYDRFLPGLHR
jgi:hypothetical protein